jgi:hypothetical protein
MVRVMKSKRIGEVPLAQQYERRLHLSPPSNDPKALVPSEGEAGILDVLVALYGISITYRLLEQVSVC